MSKKLNLILAATLAMAVAAPAAFANTLEKIEGKWSLQKETEQWGKVTQTVQFKDGSFSYEVKSSDGVVVRAKGKVKVEEMGSFRVMRLSDISGAYGEDALEPTYDDRAMIYRLDWNKLILATNFDQFRYDEDPACDVYRKAKQ